MMATTAALRCKAITPEAQIYDGPAESVVLPAHDGEIGILANRAMLLCKLGSGRLKIRPTGGCAEETWFVDGGFAQVVDNSVVVLTQKAVPPAQIDKAKGRPS